jgi:hypothetical protein
LVVAELGDDVDEHRGHFRSQVRKLRGDVACALPGERGDAVGHKRILLPFVSPAEVVQVLLGHGGHG